METKAMTQLDNTTAMPEWAILAAGAAGLDLSNATYHPSFEYVEFSLDYRTTLEREPGQDGPDIRVLVSDFGAVWVRDASETVLIRCRDDRQTKEQSQAASFKFAAGFLKLLNGDL